MKFCHYLLLSFLFSLSFVNSNAQVKDVQLWADFQISHKVSDITSIEWENGLRVNENISEFGFYYSEISTKFKLYKGLSLSGNYRFAAKRKIDDSYSNRHRFSLDLGYKTSFRQFTLSLRSRVQTEFKNVETKPKGSIPESAWRNKIQIKYSLNKKIKPFVSSEFYIPILNSERFELNKLRSSIGFEYKLNKRNSLEPYYLIDYQLNEKNPHRYFVFGISYICSF